MITRENTFKDYPDIVSTAQMMKMLGVGRNTAYNLLRTKEINSITIGGIYKIPTQNIIEYINRHLITK